MSSKYEVITCPICGDSRYEERNGVYVCKTCDAPFFRVTDEENTEVIHLLNMANLHRQNGDYDFSIKIYQEILNKNNDELSAYEGLMLAKYGIEYVYDRRTERYYPTCHRMNFKSIYEDEEYQKYLSKCNLEEKAILEKRAQDINRLQIEIKKQLENEKPYDVFISYKATDKAGNPTIDSEIARDIYDELKKRDLRVFYSEVELKKRISVDYEPIIYYALQCSKAFILVGTSKENVESTWVRNEWSRFIERIEDQTDETTRMNFITVYKDMSPYDMPKIGGKQGQGVDANLVGWTKRLADGVDELLGRVENESVVQSVPEIDVEKIKQELSEDIKRKLSTEITITNKDNNTEGVNIKNLLTRAEILISQGNFTEANKKLDDVLDQDPKHSTSYLYKVLIKNKFKSIEELKRSSINIEKDPDFQCAFRYSNDKETIKKIIEEMKNNQKQEQLEYEYQKALNLFDKEYFTEAYEAFTKLGNYKNSAQLANNACYNEKNKIYNLAEELKTNKKYQEAVKEFEKIIDHRDSKQQILNCEELFIENKYQSACALAKNKNYKEAMKIFEELGDYKDSAKKYLQIVEYLKKKQHAEIINEIEKELANKTRIPNKQKLEDLFNQLKLLKYCEEDAELIEKYKRKHDEVTKRNTNERRNKTILIVVFCLAISAMLGYMIYYINYLNNHEHTYENNMCTICYEHEYLEIDTKTITGVKGDKTLITEISIPNSVTSIGNSVFKDCTSLTSITIPNSVTSIGKWSFINCTNLKNITIPSNVTSIGDGAFKNCTSLINIEIPNSVTSIGDETFYNCTSLESVSIPNSVTSIGGFAFYRCTSLTSIEISSSVLSIGGSAFYYCTSLENIIVPSSVTSVGYCAFAGCKNLTIYCEASSQPNSWNEKWMGVQHPTINWPKEIIWGYQK